MTWFAVDDRFHQHRKVIRLRRSPAYGAALALWTLSGSWAAGDEQARLTGMLDVDVLRSFALPDTDAGIDALVEVGLWTCDGECVTFHDWTMWNGPGAKAQRYDSRLAADRLRQQKHRTRPKPSQVSRDSHVTEHREEVSRDGHVSRGTGRDGPGSGRDGKGSPVENAGTGDAAVMCIGCGGPLDPAFVSFGTHPACVVPEHPWPDDDESVLAFGASGGSG